MQAWAEFCVKQCAMIRCPPVPPLPYTRGGTCPQCPPPPGSYAYDHNGRALNSRAEMHESHSFAFCLTLTRNMAHFLTQKRHDVGINAISPLAIGSVIIVSFTCMQNILYKDAYMYALYTPSSFHNSQTEQDMETKLTSIDFSRRVTKESRSSRLQTLGNQLIDRSLYIRYTFTNRKHYSLYNTT